MKKMMMALAALCVAGAASAVTVSWTDVSTNDATHGQVNLGTALSKEGFSVKMTINLTAVPTSIGENWWPTLVSLGLQTDGTASINVSLTQDKNLQFDNKKGIQAGTSNNQKVSSDVALTTGEHTIVISYDGTTEKLYLGYDGAVIATMDYTLSYDPDCIAWGRQAGWDSGTYLDKQNGGFTYTISSLQTTDAVVLPEPTALALLALGVAGVALRRRVA